MSFEQWMQRLDRVVYRACGMTSSDLPDACFHDWYTDGITPAQGARLLIEAAFQ
jgi:hypothetical protein